MNRYQLLDGYLRQLVRDLKETARVGLKVDIDCCVRSIETALQRAASGGNVNPDEFMDNSDRRKIERAIFSLERMIELNLKKVVSWRIFCHRLLEDLRKEEEEQQ